MELILLKKTIHSACIWLTALCVFVQGVGAALGGVLCVGCNDATAGWGGIGLTSAPCTPDYDCCAQTDDQHKSDADDCDSKGVADPGDDCGCVDITLTAHDGALVCPPVKFILSFSHFVAPAPATLVTADVSGDLPLRWARAGPPCVRLLVPLARRTVLLN